MSWTTCLVAEEVGSSGAFVGAIALPSGAGVLQATPRLSQYRGEVVGRIFEAPAPVLLDEVPVLDEASVLPDDARGQTV